MSGEVKYSFKSSCGADRRDGRPTTERRPPVSKKNMPIRHRFWAQHRAKHIRRVKNDGQIPIRCNDICFRVRTALPHGNAPDSSCCYCPTEVPDCRERPQGTNWLKGRDLFGSCLFAAAERWNITACSPYGLLGRAEASQPSPYWVLLRSAAAVIGGTYRSMVAPLPAVNADAIARSTAGKNGDFAEVWSAGSLLFRHV